LIGPGSQMRRAASVEIFFGMLGVMLFGLFFTPIFYVVVRNLAEGKQGKLTATISAAIRRCMARP